MKTNTRYIAAFAAAAIFVTTAPLADNKAYAVPAADPAEAAAQARWRNLGDKSKHLGGPALTRHDLDGVPVIVVRYSLKHMKDAELHNLHAQCARFANHPMTIVGSIRDPKTTKGDFEEMCKKTKKEGVYAQIYPHYADFGLASGEPTAEGQCDYYIVDEKGKAVHHSRVYKDFQSFLKRFFKGKTYGDRFLGHATVPESLSSITNLLKEGKTTAPAYAFLKRQSRGPNAEDAAKLQDAMDQAWHLRLSRLIRLSSRKPGLAFAEMDELQKEFPQARNDSHWPIANQRIKSIPDVANMAKLVSDVEKIKATPITSEGEAKRFLAQAKAAHNKLQKFKTSKVTQIAVEASDYEGEIMDLVSRLENWTP